MKWRTRRGAARLGLARIAVAAVLALVTPALASAAAIAEAQEAGITQDGTAASAGDGGAAQPGVTLPEPTTPLPPGADKPAIESVPSGDQGEDGSQGDGDDQDAAEQVPNTGTGALLQKKPSDLNPALLPERDKRQEANGPKCVPRSEANPMPEIGDAAIASKHAFPWAMLGLGVAALGTVIAAVAVWLGRRRRSEDAGRTTALDLLGATVAILGGLAALAGQFYGLGHAERPPPQALVAVREVYARVPQGAYLRGMRDAHMPEHRYTAAEKGQIGNVLWLQIDLTGYRPRDRLSVLAVPFAAGNGAGQLPGRPVRMPLTPEDADHQRRFLPIWVGVPKVRFQVQLRLVDRRHRVVALNSTDDMRGDELRFLCARR